MCAGGCLPAMVGNGLRDLLKAVFLNYFFRCSSSQGMLSGAGAKGILFGRGGMVIQSTPSSAMSVSPLSEAMTAGDQSKGMERFQAGFLFQCSPFD